MALGKVLVTLAICIVTVHVAWSKSSIKSKQWAVASQKTFQETYQAFDAATTALQSFNGKHATKLLNIASKTAKIAGAFGVFGALFSIVMAFIPGSESPELTLMKSEFGKLSEKVDTISRSLDDTKGLIKLDTQRAAYIEYENTIHHGFSQSNECLNKVQNATCSGQKECKRKKVLIAEGYIQSMKVQKSLEAIWRGVTSSSTFGSSLLDLLKDESKCNVPKIDLFANKVTALITKGMSVSIFHDLLTKTDYNILDSTVVGDRMLRTLESRRQAIQQSCFANIGYWMPLDIRNSKDLFSSDIHETNTKLLQILKTKYPWIYWNVLTYKGETEPVTGPSNSPGRLLFSSSKSVNVHSFVIPTNKAKVENLQDKIAQWKNIIQIVDTDWQKSAQNIENRVKIDLTLKNQIQSFAILPGDQAVLGHYGDEMKQQTLGVVNVTTTNVFANKPKSGFFMVVSFIQTAYPPTCSNTCSGKGQCFVYPYSMKTGCRCNSGHSGEKCESSGMGLRLKTVINAIVENTMKLPTFATIQHSIEDTQLYLKTSTENIQKSITELGEKIEKQFKSLGEFVSKKFDWFAVLLEYKDAIENLNYFHSISSEKISHLLPDENLSTSTSVGNHSRFAMNEEKDIARFLLSPTGIQKWLYQLNYLIVGRQNTHFNSHKPLLFMVMDKFKDRICHQDYKDEVTRTYRQLMLLQLQGYMLWSNAYSIMNRDSSVIADKYNKVLKRQRSFLQNTTCHAAISNSTNYKNCTGGYYLYKSQTHNVVCNDGYFPKGR